MYDGKITDVPGIEVGHAEHSSKKTGCTVVLCRNGAVGGVDVRGASPGTRETDLMRPTNAVQEVNAVFLTGGSAFGLSVGDGIMEYLEEQGIGYDTGVARVPIVPGAVLFDLAYGDSSIRPDAQMGYMACKNASAKEVSQGIVGAGAGATVGKILGMDFCMKGGIGTASIKLPSGVIVGAIVAVNAFGDVIDIENGNILAGARHPDNKGVFLNTKEFLFKKDMNIEFSSTNTTIGVVATNAKLSKEGANKLASMAHDGLAISISPVHTMVDGDTLFCLSTGDKKEDINILGMAAVEVVARAVNNAVLSVMPKR